MNNVHNKVVSLDELRECYKERILEGTITRAREEDNVDVVVNTDEHNEHIEVRSGVESARVLSSTVFNSSLGVVIRAYIRSYNSINYRVISNISFDVISSTISPITYETNTLGMSSEDDSEFDYHEALHQSSVNKAVETIIAFVKQQLDEIYSYEDTKMIPNYFRSSYIESKFDDRDDRLDAVSVIGFDPCNELEVPFNEFIRSLPGAHFRYVSDLGCRKYQFDGEGNVIAHPLVRSAVTANSKFIEIDSTVLMPVERAGVPLSFIKSRVVHISSIGIVDAIDKNGNVRSASSISIFSLD